MSVVKLPHRLWKNNEWSKVFSWKSCGLTNNDMYWKVDRSPHNKGLYRMSKIHQGSLIYDSFLIDEHGKLYQD